jgi:hypothetical protein
LVKGKSVRGLEKNSPGDILGSMDITYRLKPNELNDDFFKTLKNTFLGKEISVTVEEIEDTTAYLLSNEANKEHLLEGVESSKAGSCVHSMSFEELETMIHEN